MAVALAVTLDEARLAARLAVTGMPAGNDTLTITRQAPGEDAIGVRGAVDVATGGAATFVIRDYELPFDVTVTYTGTVYDGVTNVGTDSETFQIAWDECEVWLIDLARPTNSLPLEVESMRELAFASAVGVHRVLDRRAPVLTQLPAYTPTSELIVLTTTLAERDRTRLLLGSGYPFLLRAGDELGIGNMYLGVTEFVEERILTLGSAPYRRFRVATVEVEQPDPAIYVPSAPATYASVKAAYATYAALKAAVANYDEMAYTYPD